MRLVQLQLSSQGQSGLLAGRVADSEAVLVQRRFLVASPGRIHSHAAIGDGLVEVGQTVLPFGR